MPVIPKIPKVATTSKKCERCGRVMPSSSFSKTRSWAYADGLLPICNECISEYINEGDGNWDRIDKICQWANIPFVVKEWDRLV
jgi:hypothetical protein